MPATVLSFESTTGTPAVPQATQQTPAPAMAPTTIVQVPNQSAITVADVASKPTDLALTTVNNQAIQAAARGVKMDRASLLAIGSTAQQQSAAISKKMLEKAKVRDLGDVAAPLGELATKCRFVDVDSLHANAAGSLMKHIPFLGRMVHTAESYLSLDGELDVIAKNLTGIAERLYKDVDDLDTLFNENKAIYDQLMVSIAISNVKLKELDDQIAVAADQPKRDLVALREALDKHTHDLELTAEIRRQNAPKIRIIQSGDIAIAEKLNSSVLNTLPLWRDNLSMAIAQARQKEALSMQNKVDDATNDMLVKGADALHVQSVAIAKTAARGAVDISTLKHTQDQLLATISEVDEIRKKSVADRAEARKSIEEMHQQVALLA